MATLSTTLTLASTDATSDILKISAVDTLTVTNPAINAARVSVDHGSATDILTSANSTTTYVYIKNTDTTNHVKLSTGASELFGILWPGQFSFFAILDAEGLKAQANNAPCVVEYGYWTKG